MLKIGLCGCNGRMGKVITDIVSKKENMQIVAGFDAYTEKLADYPVYADPHEFTGGCDVIIDFSNDVSLFSADPTPFEVLSVASMGISILTVCAICLTSLSSFCF